MVGYAYMVSGMLPGTIGLDKDGEAIVEMSDYLRALTNENEASIHLTPVGSPDFSPAFEAKQPRGF